MPRPGGPPKSEVRLALEALLADGLWHDREEVVLAVIPRVHPGTAHRRYETSAAQQLDGQERKRPELSQLERIRSGARQLVNEALNRGFRSGVIERRELLDGARQVRLVVGSAAAPPPGPAVQAPPSPPAPPAPDGPRLEVMEWSVVEDVLYEAIMEFMSDEWIAKAALRIAEKGGKADKPTMARRRARSATGHLFRSGAAIAYPGFRETGS